MSPSNRRHRPYDMPVVGEALYRLDISGERGSRVFGAFQVKVKLEPDHRLVILINCPQFFKHRLDSADVAGLKVLHRKKEQRVRIGVIDCRHSFQDDHCFVMPFQAGQA